MKLTRWFGRRAQKAADRERARNRERWPAEDAKIADLAEQITPLNDWFAQGKPMQMDVVLRYVCALERRIAELEKERK